MIEKDEIEEKLNSLDPEELLGSLARRIEIVEERLEEIDDEIQRREEISDKIMRQKQEKKSEYMGSLTNPHKLRKKAKGESLDQLRADMQEKIDQLDREINEEMESQWKDIQKLTEERRDLKEKKEELKRRKLAAARALGSD